MDSRTISPWKRSESSLNNPLARNEILHTRNLNIAIIDGGNAPNPVKTPLVGILIVPRGLEGDDMFSSLEGNIQLLNSAQVAEVEANLMGLMLRYYPDVCLNQPDPPKIRDAFFLAMLTDLSSVSEYLDSDNQEMRVLCLGLNDISTNVALRSGLNFDVIGIDNDPVIIEALGRFEKVGDNEITMAFHHYADYLHELRFPGSKEGFEWNKMREADFGRMGYHAVFIDIHEPALPSGSRICLCSPHTLKDFVGKVYEARLKENEFVLVATRPGVEANTDTDAIPTAELMGDSFLKKLREIEVRSIKNIS
ncbi:hypothetical protein Tco_0379628 [Tanacetum coccineum]